jgi:hypothetical protein
MPGDVALNVVNCDAGGQGNGDEERSSSDYDDRGVGWFLAGTASNAATASKHFRQFRVVK